MLWSCSRLRNWSDSVDTLDIKNRGKEQKVRDENDYVHAILHHA